VYEQCAAPGGIGNTVSAFGMPVAAVGFRQLHVSTPSTNPNKFTAVFSSAYLHETQNLTKRLQKVFELISKLKVVSQLIFTSHFQTYLTSY
jgi:hypothetical protein